MEQIDTFTDEAGNTWTGKHAEFARKAQEELGREVSSYSGRGMYGKTCPAVIVDSVEDTIADLGMRGLRTDNMGMSYVVYLP